jgi:hypothetical protein
VKSEDVVDVLRNVHGAVVTGGHVLDIHPLPLDFAVRVGQRGIGFVDLSRYADVVERMEDGVASALAAPLFVVERSLRRHVVERYDSARELQERADEWETLRLPPPVRRRLRESEGPVELVDTVRYRLFRRL